MNTPEQPGSISEAVAATQSQGSTEPVVLSADEKNWGMACHLSALSGFLIPFGSIAGPLIVWLVKRNEYDYVDVQGKEALNFQLTVMIALLVSGVLVLVVIGFLLLAIVSIGALILTIISAIKASNGEAYQYPFTIRFLK